MAWVQKRLDETCGGGIIVGIRDTSHLDELKTLRGIIVDQEDMLLIRAILDKGNKPQGDIWDRERLPGSIVYPFTQPNNWPLLAFAYGAPVLVRQVRNQLST